MRIAVGQILQETNTLNPLETLRADFEVYGLAWGDGVMGAYGDVGELAGFSRLPEALGEEIEWVGLVGAVAWSNGPVAGAVLDELVEAAAGPLRETQVDGVIFSLHGALSATTDFDVSGRVLRAVRQALGESADVLVGYHSMPHIDHVCCGGRAARVLARLLQTGERPRISAWKIPMVTNSDGRTTDRGVQADLWRRIAAAEDRPEVFTVGLYMVQPWFDVAELGWTLYQAYSGDEPSLEVEAVIGECWETRGYRETSFLRPEEVVPAAREIEGGPVAISESHDATNSGAPGCATPFLDEVEFCQVNRPLFPLDDIADVSAAGWAGDMTKGRQ